MIPQDTELDLLAICSAAPAQLAYGATVLLAREMLARLDDSGREVRSNTQHPVLLDLQGAPTAGGLSALLASRNPSRGGASAARFFLNWSQPGSPGFPGGTVPRTSPAAPTYGQVLTDVLATAADLRALALSTMGATAFNAARAPFVAEFALSAFAKRADVARYGVGVGVKPGSTAPGAAFLLESRGTFAAGFSELTASSTPAISVPAPGLYHWHFFGSARSASTANPTTCGVSLVVAGAEVASVSATRASSDVNDTVALGEERYLFASGEGPTIEIDDVLTLRNGSASNETIGGILLLWPP